MKGIRLLIFLFVFVNTVKAQNDYESEAILLRYKPGIMWYFSGLEPYEVGKLRKYDRLVINLNYNDWNSQGNVFESPWNSMGVDFAFFFDIPFTKNNTIGMGIGPGFSHYSNRTKWKFVNDFEHKSTHAFLYSEETEPDKNLYGANYLELPVEFRFRTKGYSHFKFMIGGKIGYRINDYTKEVYRIKGKKYISKNYGFVDSNPFRYGVTARIGIRNWALFGAYYFSPLFTHKESIELYPLSVGLSISLY